jgi:hypothetical protein
LDDDLVGSIDWEGFWIVIQVFRSNHSSLFPHFFFFLRQSLARAEPELGLGEMQVRERERPDRPERPERPVRPERERKTREIKRGKEREG